MISIEARAGSFRRFEFGCRVLLELDQEQSEGSCRWTRRWWSASAVSVGIVLLLFSFYRGSGKRLIITVLMRDRC